MGTGEALLVNQSDAELLVAIQITYRDDVETLVEAGQTATLSRIGGGFGVAPMICDETGSLRVERADDAAIVIAHAACQESAWVGEVVGDYAKNWTITVTQAMVDAATSP